MYVLRLTRVDVTSPTVTDNSGLIKELTASYDLNLPVTDDVNITWTATDYEGNTADSSGLCVVEVHVYGTYLVELIYQTMYFNMCITLHLKIVLQKYNT